MCRKRVISVIAGLLLLCLYSMIFSFSAQDGAESGSLSAMVTEKCVELLNVISGEHWSEAVMQGMTQYFEHPVRKLAHFSEYAAMGILVCTLLRQWMRRGRLLYAATVLWVFISAAADELHQYFVPGRYASLPDVLLDTCGGIAGLAVCLAAESAWRRIRSKSKSVCPERKS